MRGWHLPPHRLSLPVWQRRFFHRYNQQLHRRIPLSANGRLPLPGVAARRSFSAPMEVSRDILTGETRYLNPEHGRVPETASTPSGSPGRLHPRTGCLIPIPVQPTTLRTRPWYTLVLVEDTIVLPFLPSQRGVRSGSILFFGDRNDLPSSMATGPR